MFLNYLYWIVLILSIAGLFMPWPRVSSAAAVVLFACIGLRLFPVSLS
jgi:hypothetical protein